MQSLYPKNFSRFYDTIYAHHPLSEQNDFYLNELKKSQGPVLEVGVGTGRHYIDGLNSGADIYGIDISGWMLEVLKSKLNKDQHYRISNQIINVYFTLEWNDEEGNQEEKFNTPMRYFFRYELEHLIERSDFDSYEIKGDFQGSSLDNSSKEFIIHCFKK